MSVKRNPRPFGWLGFIVWGTSTLVTLSIGVANLVTDGPDAAVGWIALAGVFCLLWEVALRERA